MSEQHDPPPLKAGKGARPELRDALDALGKQDVDSARLSRVAEKLGPLFESSAGPALGSSLLRHAPRKLLYGRLAVFALTLGATAAVWLQRAPPTPVAQTARERPVQTSQPVVQPSPLPEPVGEQAAEPVAPVLPAATPRPSARPARVGHRRVERVEHAKSAPELSRTLHIDPTAPEPTAQTELEPAAPPEPPPPDKPEAARALSEVELLFEARKQMQREPRAALVLLDEHKTRFEDGQLAPEREVLAIEVLRKLGQTTAATARLRAFRARYPDSLHLRRLDPP